MTTPTPIPTALLGSPRVTARPYKRCSCGAIYTLEAWLRLPLVGWQDININDGGPSILLEHRNCMCGSTLAIDHYDLSDAR